MTKYSAGLLLYRERNSSVEVFLVHPGGPFWARKDLHAWSIPKGEYTPPDDALKNACREFVEETGIPLPPGVPQPLTPIRQAGGKIVQAWYLQGDVDAAAVRSNTFTLEWPPRSGTLREFPEVDKAAWFSLGEARTKVHKGQVTLIDELASRLAQK